MLLIILVGLGFLGVNEYMRYQNRSTALEGLKAKLAADNIVWGGRKIASANIVWGSRMALNNIVWGSVSVAANTYSKNKSVFSFYNSIASDQTCSSVGSQIVKAIDSGDRSNMGKLLEAFAKLNCGKNY